MNYTLITATDRDRASLLEGLTEEEVAEAIFNPNIDLEAFRKAKLQAADLRATLDEGSAVGAPKRRRL